MKIKASLLSAALLLTAATRAQVVLSEINFTPQGTGGTQWIELHNLGSTKVDLSSWSVYLATNTPGRIGNYWFGMPTGVEIEGRAFLRLHWLAFQSPSVTPTDVYTGTTVFNFLFGYGAEPLQEGSGALALISSQANLDMNNPAFVRDWVSWGASGQRREPVAIQAGMWRSGEFVPAPGQGTGDSIALNYGMAAEPTPAIAYFRCARPTPNMHNHDRADLGVYGVSCSVGTVQAPTLEGISIPAVGNRDFALNVRDTSLNQNVVLLFSPVQGDGSLRLGQCQIWLGVLTPPVAVAFPAQQGNTLIPLPIPTSVQFGTVFAQSVVLFGMSGSDYGLSNGLGITLSL